MTQTVAILGAGLAGLALMIVVHRVVLGRDAALDLT